MHIHEAYLKKKRKPAEFQPNFGPTEFSDKALTNNKSKFEPVLAHFKVLHRNTARF